MHVRKFEGDSLDEVIRQVKKELGPDAIILKTKTNKGLSGAFKKSRVEITAAISERSYVSKANVDRVLPDDVKENFYKNSAAEVNQTIKNYNSYDKMGLNKPASSTKTKKAPASPVAGLDDFLSKKPAPKAPTRSQAPKVQLHEFISDIEEAPKETVVRYGDMEEVQTERNFVVASEKSSETEYSNKLKTQEEKIKALEDKLSALIQDVSVQNESKKGPKGTEELKTILKTMDINDRIVHKLIRKINAHISYGDQDDSDVVFDLALRELTELISTKYPNFSKVSEKSNITVFISEGASGQSTCIRKLAALKKGTKVLTLVSDKGNGNRVDKLLDIEVEEVTCVSEIISQCRKIEQSDNALFIDIDPSHFKNEGIKDLVDNLKRIFSEVEILLSISSIHSEIYNRKIISKYSELADGIIINHIDKCLNYGALINIHEEYNKIPLVFYGTGRVIPEDIEAATPERLIASLFKL